MPEDSVPAVESGTAQVSHLSPSADGALLNRDTARDREHFDLIAITETWLTNEVPDSVYHLPSFVIFRRDRPDRLGGGVLCFARSSLQPFAIDPLLDRGQDFELLWIAMRPHRLPRPLSLIVVAVLYCPPWYDASTKKQLIDHIIACVDSLNKRFNHPGFFYNR